jgi:signal transduction histidine kinase
LRVEDKGKGFRLSSLQSSNGLGVASMRERVELVNGRFNIVSKPGKGTQVVAEVPLPAGRREESV